MIFESPVKEQSMTFRSFYRANIDDVARWNSYVIPLVAVLQCSHLPSFPENASCVSVRFEQVLSLKLYKSVKPSSSTETKPADKEDSKQETKTVEDSGAAAAAAATSASSEASPTVEEDEGGHDPFEGLDDITKTCFEVCTKAVSDIHLRAYVLVAFS